MSDRWRDEDRYGRGYRDEDRERAYAGDFGRGGRSERDFGGYGGSSYGGGFGREGAFGGDYGRSGRDWGGEYSDYGPGTYVGGTDRDYRGDYGRSFGSGRDYGRSGYGSDWGRDYGRYGATGYGRGESFGRPGFGREDYRRAEDRGFFERAGDTVRSWFSDEDDERGRGYRGRGPKGYTRSDDRIREDVCDRLTDDPRIDASDVEISVSNGEVTLSGTVDSRQAKRRAEDTAEEISGVKDVQNNLRVQEFSGRAGTTGATGAIGTTTAGAAAESAGTAAGTKTRATS
jgi:osmotically-inducible protein OsmY